MRDLRPALRPTLRDLRPTLRDLRRQFLGHLRPPTNSLDGGDIIYYNFKNFLKIILFYFEYEKYFGPEIIP